MRKGFLWLGIGGVALLAVAMLAGPAPAYYHRYRPAKPEPKAVGPVVDVKGWEFAFRPKELVIKPGAVTLRLENAGEYPHNLTIEELRRGTPVVSPGRTGDLSVTLKEGTYTIYCAVKGHRKQGMEGTLIVRAGQ